MRHLSELLQLFELEDKAKYVIVYNRQLKDEGTAAEAAKHLAELVIGVKPPSYESEDND